MFELKLVKNVVSFHSIFFLTIKFPLIADDTEWQK